jgi:hypothetical protein
MTFVFLVFANSVAKVLKIFDICKDFCRKYKKICTFDADLGFFSFP